MTVVAVYIARNSRMNGNEFHLSLKIPFDKLRNDIYTLCNCRVFNVKLFRPVPFDRMVSFVEVFSENRN